MTLGAMVSARTGRAISLRTAKCSLCRGDLPSDRMARTSFQPSRCPACRCAAYTRRARRAERCRQVYTWWASLPPLGCGDVAEIDAWRFSVRVLAYRTHITQRLLNKAMPECQEPDTPQRVDSRASSHTCLSTSGAGLPPNPPRRSFRAGGEATPRPREGRRVAQLWSCCDRLAGREGSRFPVTVSARSWHTIAPKLHTPVHCQIVHVSTRCDPLDPGTACR